MQPAEGLEGGLQLYPTAPHLCQKRPSSWGRSPSIALPMTCSAGSPPTPSPGSVPPPLPRPRGLLGLPLCRAGRAGAELQWGVSIRWSLAEAAEVFLSSPGVNRLPRNGWTVGQW